MPDLSRLITPRSVAIVGASPTLGALGNSVMRNLDRHGFSGAVHLINPKRSEIDGRPCLPSITDLPEGVDVAVLAIPGPAVLPAVRELAARKAGAAIIFSAGFAEGGDEGLAAQAEVARIARDHDMIVLGPNCLGLVNYAAGVPLTFIEAPVLATENKPAVAIVSQSGAMAVVLGTTLMAKDLALTLSVSTGNEAASGVEDYVEHLLGDSGTQAIAMIVEQFRQPARFLCLVERARDIGKPIVLLHPGTSSAARESAATHTGAMAGDWQLMKAKVTRAGAILVDSLEALGDVTELAVRAGKVRAGGTAVLTESGAFKALTLDLAEQIGLDLPPMSGATADALRGAIPDFIPVSNPMDLTAQALVDPDLYRRTLIPLLADDAFAALVFGIIQTDPATSSRKFLPITEAITALAPEKPIIFAGLDEGAEVPADYVTGLRAVGVTYFPSPDRAFRALRHLIRAAAQDHGSAPASPIRLDVPGGVVPEYAAKRLLGPVGLPFPPGGFAASLEEAVKIAGEIGYPIALKAQAAALSHKSDAGGVILSIADEASLEAAWERLYGNVAAYDSAIALDGAQVEAMGKRGVELIVGARNDPEWGPVILVGFGGVTAELLHDVRLLPIDLPREAIVAELRALKQGALLDGYRGSPALDVEAVAALIETLGRVLAGTPSIREIDLNPVIVFPRGEGVVALDALILAEQE
ncbi:acyl-CoA synthetase (NDP forming) [Sphingomonas kaistensis]|uniref:Acyl-CoA synthetase (NDP forming) n=1 Tax=Sphingomonas kaistensis TaxID=298708 RepID=A0A7X6BFV0_9SPHN|nr:acetate--CoA ligase family protein [Sphingomonas kaistensis]NJC04401.1 acyl-CoA synthetase (NDP forming) [Sphingomonas kaistensis]